MRKIIGMTVLATVLLGSPAAAQESASGFWHDSWAPRDANERAVDVYIAEAQLRARNDGYDGETTVNYNGTVNSTTTYEGTVISSGSTNIGQSNSTDVSINGSGNGLSVSSGQTSGTMTQSASSGAGTTSGPVGVVGINAGQGAQ